VQSYVVRGAGGKVVQLSFNAASEISTDPTITTLVNQLRRVH
jgi:hypothetical protein